MNHNQAAPKIKEGLWPKLLKACLFSPSIVQTVYSYSIEVRVGNT